MAGSVESRAQNEMDRVGQRDLAVAVESNRTATGNGVFQVLLTASAHHTASLETRNTGPSKHAHTDQDWQESPHELSDRRAVARGSRST